MARKSPGRKRPDGASPIENVSIYPLPAFADDKGTPVRESRHLGRKNEAPNETQPHKQPQVDVVRAFIVEHLCDGDLSVLFWWDNLRKV